MHTIQEETNNAGLTLRYFEKTEDDYDEILGGYTPETITYRPVTINRRECYAIGFSWAHPAGAVISATFPRPLLVLTELRQEGWDEVDTTRADDEVYESILDMLGPVAGVDDLYVQFEGRA